MSAPLGTLPAPILWTRELALPKPCRAVAGTGFLMVVVAPVGDGPALLHHVGADVSPVHGAAGENALVTVAAGGAAAHGLAGGEVDQGPGRSVAAPSRAHRCL